MIVKISQFLRYKTCQSRISLVIALTWGEITLQWEFLWIILFLVFRVENPGDLPVSPLNVQPLPTEEDSSDAIGCVSDFHAIQQPARAQTRVVVLHPNFLQLSHVQHFQQETVRLLTFEKVAKLLPQLPTAWISIGAIDSDENIGISACSLLITRDDDDLVLDGHQASSFTGEALDGLCALEGQEIIPLWGEWDEGITNEDVPGGEDTEKKEFNLLPKRKNDWM